MRSVGDGVIGRKQCGAPGAEHPRCVIGQGGPAMEAEKMLMMSGESLEQLKGYGRELQQLRVPTDVFRR